MGNIERQIRLTLVYSYLCNRNRDCRSKKFLIDFRSNWLTFDLDSIVSMLIKLGVRYPIKDFLFNEYYIGSVKFTRKFEPELFDYVTKKLKESTRGLSVVDFLINLREAETVLARVILTDKEKVHEIWYNLVDLIVHDPCYIYKIPTLIDD